MPVIMTHHITLAQSDSDACLFFAGDQLIVNITTKNPILPYQSTVDALQLNILNALSDGSIRIISCKMDPSNEANPVLGTFPVKRFLSEVDATLQSRILRAYHWLNWESQSQYCGKCGTPLEYKADSTEKKCLACNLSFFPRFSPAVMVLIQKDDKILLARSPHFPPGIYSAIAGFIDLGETAEEAAHREVKEELGIEITQLEYFATQTWPFPDSFMIAFKAQYRAGELKIDEHEIEDARWFSANELPLTPPTASIAKLLIQSALKGNKLR